MRIQNDLLELAQNKDKYEEVLSEMELVKHDTKIPGYEGVPVTGHLTE